MRNTNDKLSRAATAILKSEMAESEIADDLSAFYAPSECYGDAFRFHQKQLIAALNELGFADEDEVRDKISDRGVSFHRSIYLGMIRN